MREERKGRAPRIIEDLSSALTVVVQEGETVELVCNVTGVPLPTVTWYRLPTGLMHDEDRALQATRRKKQIGENGEVLVIYNVTRYCDDVYECVAHNDVPHSAHRSIRVYVEFPPEVRLPNRKIGQSKRKTTILECVVTAYPHAITVWRRHGHDIQRNSKYNLEVYDEDENTLTLALRVQSLTEEDYGQYQCVSENKLGKDSETMVLYGRVPLPLWYGAPSSVVWCPFLCGMVPLPLWYGAPSSVVWCPFLYGMVPLPLWYGAPSSVVWCPFLCGMVPLPLWYGAPSSVVWCPFLCGMVPLPLWYGAPSSMVWCPFFLYGAPPSSMVWCPFLCANGEGNGWWEEGPDPNPDGYMGRGDGHGNRQYDREQDRHPDPGYLEIGTAKTSGVAWCRVEGWDHHFKK
ncbi:hypothetical protein ACOMHN_042295 [Nucella lapillus]